MSFCTAPVCPQWTGTGILALPVTRRTQFRLLVLITLAWLAWAAMAFLGASEPFTLKVVDDRGDPVAEAVVASGRRQLGLTGSDGTVEIDPRKQPIEISALGHVSAVVATPQPENGVLDAVLKARVLRGTVVDSSGRPVIGAQVTTRLGTGTSGDDGSFVVRRAEPGPVTISRPAWEDTTFEWGGGPGDHDVSIDPAVIKAVHVSGEAVENRFEEFVRMAETTELNALMVDVKDETGRVFYRSQVPTVAAVGAQAEMFDLRQVVAIADASDLYLIARLVAFQDPIAAAAAPEMAVWDEERQAPFSSRGQYFLDPTDAEARAYALDLAVEVCSMGVDEIQFDYVRFPDARPESVVFDGGVTEEIRRDTVRSFLVEAVAVLRPMGCAVAADVFGFVTTADDDGGIGQSWPDVTSVVDVASPMLYPSHYTAGWFGFDSPTDHPGAVVDRALADGLNRLRSQVVVRPWLQDFGYSAEQVREQIDIAEGHGLGWMLWNAASVVTTDALREGE